MSVHVTDPFSNPCLYKPAISFTHVVSMTVEEWNKNQDRIAKLEADCTRWRTTAEETAAKLEDAQRRAQPDFEEAWKAVIASPSLATLWGNKGKARLWLVPSFESPTVPDFRVGPGLRGVLGWPNHNSDMVSNRKNLYSIDRNGNLYRELTALVAAKPPPESTQTPDAANL